MKQTAVEYLAENIDNLIPFMNNDIAKKFSELVDQAKEMEKNSYICSKCKSQINEKEIVQQMQDSEKSD
jgi:signal-transduction protein with cAMP-binding, CBS, and nucleotidyltransferase domain